VIRLPINEPLMKLDPTIKPIGNFTVSFIKRLTLLFLVLFCIPIINKKNKQEFIANAKIIFLNIKNIIHLYLNFNLNYKLCFF
tara:strand:+ start:36 stop:284 length:249 start_codon:yes stop_codon:yes gene_type:complete